MSVSSPLTIPAAAAIAAYLNARCGIFYDTELLLSIVPAAANTYWRQLRGRLNLFYQFESIATSKSSAKRDFLRFEDTTWTYTQAYDVVLRCSSWLRTTRGVSKGDIVALDFQNTDFLIFLILALWAIGAKPALINHTLSGKSLLHSVKTATTRFIMFDPTVAENVAPDVLAELRDVNMDIFSSELVGEVMRMDPVRPPDDLRNDARNESLAALVYTSGTTGLPKAAIVSWAKISVVGPFSAGWIGTRSDDVFYTAMPLYHATALIMGFAHTLLSGATFAVSRKFSKTRFWDEVRKHEATIIQYVGETCRYLLTIPPAIDPVTGENLDKKHRVRVAFGNGLRPDVWNRFKERFGIETIAEFYAATEGTFGTWNKSRNDFSRGAIGRTGSFYNLVMGSGWAVVQVDYEKDEPFRSFKTGFCQRAKPHEPGELLFKLPSHDIKSRFQGYYNDECASEKKILRSVFTKGDAWFRTGDIIRQDSENRLYFMDRIGDTFRWKSENVSTAEVAEVIGLHPAIRELNVYGVRLPHHDGRAGCVAVVLDDAAWVGHDSEPKAKVMASIAASAKKQLPKHAVPQFLRLVKSAALEVTGTNKHPKNLLRDQGICPIKTHPDEIYWLRGDTYVKFDSSEWEEMNAGKLKL